MTAWSKEGTVSVSTGSQTVTGVGAKFLSNNMVGDGFCGPDGGWYEVINIASENAISIYPPYKGPATSGAAYLMAPLQGYPKESAKRLRQLTDQFGDALSDLTGKTVVVSVAGVAANELNNDVPAAGLKTALGIDNLVVKETGKGLSSNDYTLTEKNKLAGIAAGATANSSDATLVNRANHTGTQLAATISNFAAAVLSVALAGLSVATSTAVVAADSVLVGIGKLQAQLNNLVRVATANDVTAGRLVTPGWMGLGTVAGLALPSGNANAALPSGRYFVQTTWTGSPFSGADNKNRGYIDVGSWGQDGYQVQEFTPLFYVASNPKMFRTNVGGTWGGWFPVPVGYIAAKDSVTAGELIAVGHAGWNGGFAIVVGNGANCDTLVSALLYALNGTYTGGPSFFSGNPFFLRVSVHGLGYEVQEAIGITNPLKATRRRVNGTWGEWVPDITGFNVTADPALGSGGVIYRGSNGNGFFVKFVDGTLICWQHRVSTQSTTSVAAGAGFQGATSVSYTFPVAFVGADDVQVIPRATYVSGAYQPWAIATGQSLTGVVIIPMSFANNVVATCGYIAIGRWK